MGAALRSFLCILYWSPQITFFAYYMEPLRSLSSHTIWGPSQISFIVYYMSPPPPQISFFACYRGATSDFIFFYKIYGGLLRSVSPLTIWGPLRLVSLLTILICYLLLILLFTVYLDQLILALKESGIGCHLNGMFVGAFIHADDVTLLAPTSMALKAMLSRL